MRVRVCVCFYDRGCRFKLNVIFDHRLAQTCNLPNLEQSTARRLPIVHLHRGV